MTKKAIWYTEGWEGLGLRVRFLMWLIRQMYRLRLLDEEMVKRSVHAVVGAELLEEAKEKGLRAKILENQKGGENNGDSPESDKYVP